jgi:hypothetical protein
VAKDKQIKALSVALDKEIKSLVLELMLECQANIIEATPIDTGWARSNWFVVFGADKEINYNPNISVETAKNLQTFYLYKMLEWDRDKGEIYIVNNVPYIGRLNNGYSKQAPSGFVEKAISQAIQTVSGKDK